MTHEFLLAVFLGVLIIYILFLFVVSRITSRRAEGNAYYKGDRKAPWPVVAYGMVGATITGVTYVSVPGNVLVQNFYYIPMVAGFVVGYIIVATMLIPLYYRLNLTSIYSYLEERFGAASHMSGAVAFMVSRITGSAVRLFMVILVLVSFLPPFVGGSNLLTFLFCTVIFITLVYLYTYRGGVKTIIWTDVIQTTVTLSAVVLTVFSICREMGWNFGEMLSGVMTARNPETGVRYTTIFDWDWNHATNAVKQFISGIFVTIVMTGLDQSMMQKNLACRNLREAQKNVVVTGLIIAVATIVFLLLGALLAIYVQSKGGMVALGIEKTDQVFPVVASRCLGMGLGVLFLLGLISAAFPCASSAMTSLTSSVCVDFLNLADRNDVDEMKKVALRHWVQGGVASLLVIIIVVLYLLSNDAVINLVYKFASYTYGPVLGLFFFGILTRWKIRDGAAPYIAAASPLLCFAIDWTGRHYLGFELGFTLLIVNGFITFAALFLFRKRNEK